MTRMLVGELLHKCIENKERRIELLRKIKQNYEFIMNLSDHETMLYNKRNDPISDPVCQKRYVLKRGSSFPLFLFADCHDAEKFSDISSELAKDMLLKRKMKKEVYELILNGTYKPILDCLNERGKNHFKKLNLERILPGVVERLDTRITHALNVCVGRLYESGGYF